MDRHGSQLITYSWLSRVHRPKLNLVLIPKTLNYGCTLSGCLCMQSLIDTDAGEQGMSTAASEANATAQVQLSALYSCVAQMCV